MLINLDRIDFLNEIVITHSMKKVFNSIYHRSFKCVIKINIDDVAIFKDRDLTM